MPVVMDADRISRTLTRIAHEIVERNKGTDDLAFVGVRTRGVPIARRIARTLREITGQDIPTGSLDITLYRDDTMRHAVGPQPLVRRTEIPFSIDDRKILLVDDVLYTGRTTRAALDALIDFGRPRVIQLIVLVDRGHRELPIKADYVGKNLPTSSDESVQVRLQESDNRDEVVLEAGPPPRTPARWGAVARPTNARYTHLKDALDGPPAWLRRDSTDDPQRIMRPQTARRSGAPVRRGRSAQRAGCWPDGHNRRARSWRRAA